MPTKAEMEQELAQLRDRNAVLEAEAAAPVQQAPVVEKKPLAPADASKEEFLKELNEEQEEIWAHRFESDAFVRAFAWARYKGNETKACLIYADAHEDNHEDSDEPVAVE